MAHRLIALPATSSARGLLPPRDHTHLLNVRGAQPLRALSPRYRLVILSWPASRLGQPVPPTLNAHAYLYGRGSEGFARRKINFIFSAPPVFLLPEREGLRPPWPLRRGSDTSSWKRRESCIREISRQVYLLRKVLRSLFPRQHRSTRILSARWSVVKPRNRFPEKSTAEAEREEFICLLSGSGGPFYDIIRIAGKVHLIYTNSRNDGSPFEESL